MKRDLPSRRRNHRLECQQDAPFVERVHDLVGGTHVIAPQCLTFDVRAIDLIRARPFGFGAIKRFLKSGEKGIRTQDLIQAIRDEFKENEDLPNTTNPDDWARISGKKGERIVYIRTLVTGKGAEAGRSIDTVPNTGQYL